MVLMNQFLDEKGYGYGLINFFFVFVSLCVCCLFSICLWMLQVSDFGRLNFCLKMESLSCS